MVSRGDVNIDKRTEYPNKGEYKFKGTVNGKKWKAKIDPGEVEDLRLRSTFLSANLTGEEETAVIERMRDEV